MFDKWKSKNALCKAYKLYNKKKMPYLKAGTMNLYEQFQDIQYAIAYVLCECFNFNYNFFLFFNGYSMKISRVFTRFCNAIIQSRFPRVGLSNNQKFKHNSP